jgi:tripartite-type tricarboxylate transporter receptor subunit TctC
MWLHAGDLATRFQGLLLFVSYWIPAFVAITAIDWRIRSAGRNIVRPENENTGRADSIAALASFVVAFAAGGAADTAARAVGQKIQEILGQSVVIENRTGGNAVVAESAVMQSPRDGYTFLVDAANQLTNPVLMHPPPFDYRQDFIPVSQICDFPQVIAVKHDFPAKDIHEFVAYMRANPNKVSWGTPPAAGMAHLAGEEFGRRVGVRWLHTPYRGGADAARDIAAGVIDSVLITTNSIRPPVQAGRARILAVTSSQRVPTLPDVPTISETVAPGFDMNDWNGLFAAKGVPMLELAPQLAREMDRFSCRLLVVDSVAFACGGDPSKAPRVEEVKPPQGWTRPEDGLAAKHAAGQAKRKAESEGDTGGGN